MKILNFQAVYPFGGYVIKRVSHQAVGTQIDLRIDLRRTHRCSDCDGHMSVGRTRNRVVYDLPCGIGSMTLVTVPAVQLTCWMCKTSRTEIPPEVHPAKKATWRFMRYVSKLMKHVPADAIAELTGVSASSALRYDKTVLEADLPPPCLEGITGLLIDEKQVRRGHGYVTCVLNAATGELLHMGEGKKKESLTGFLDQLSKEQKATIEVACIDRAGSYKAALAQSLPGAKVIYDKFHLMQNLNKVIDEVRRSEMKKADGDLRGKLKGQRYLLLKRPWKMGDDAKLELRKLLSANRLITTAYILKEAFDKVWDYTTEGWARRYLLKWCGWAQESECAPLKRFARGIAKDTEPIVGYCVNQISNGRIEGFNNLISRVVHKACGMPKLDYLWLKMRQISLQS